MGILSINGIFALKGRLILGKWEGHHPVLEESEGKDFEGKLTILTDQIIFVFFVGSDTSCVLYVLLCNIVY